MQPGLDERDYGPLTIPDSIILDLSNRLPTPQVEEILSPR